MHGWTQGYRSVPGAKVASGQTTQKTAPPLAGGGWGEGGAILPPGPLPPTPSRKGRGGLYLYLYLRPLDLSAASVSLLLRLVRHEPFAAVGAAIYGAIIVAAVFAPQLAPYDPREILR